MNKTLLKILFCWQKPKIIVATNKEILELTRKFIAHILSSPVLLDKKVLIVDAQEPLDLKGKKYLILNYDDENAQKIKRESPIKVLTFGFWSGADFRASDVKMNGGINFKINYQGNIVPVWLEKFSHKEHIYPALAAAAVGDVLGLNLVEISEALRDLQ